MTSVTVMVIFFKCDTLKVTWSQQCSNSPFSTITTSVNVTETKISHAKLEACTWKNIWTKIETTSHLFYALLLLWNLDFKFNIVLFSNFHHDLFTCFAFFSTFDISQTLKFIQCRSAFLIRLDVLLLKVFSFKMFFLCSYFFMKNAYLITVKITLYVNNCL